MTEDLELTEDQGAILFPFFRGLNEERKTLNNERGRVMRELRATLEGENPDHGVIGGLVNRLEELRAGDRVLEDREFKRIRDVLNPELVARYIVFRQDFEREIREVILRARHPEPPGEIRERRENMPREDFPAPSYRP